MKDFEHFNASSIDHALSILHQYGEDARLIAGGQDLLFRIKKYIVNPVHLVNLKTIPGLRYIQSGPEGGLRIGALTTLSEIATSALVQNQYTGLAQAARSVASPQIRNMGTIGGNICQDVWCWYLQDGFSCWKSGGKFCDLASGDSSIYGSVMGGHLCLSNHPSDTAPALVALDTQVSVASPRGGRKIPISDLLPGHTWVGNRLQSHVLEPDEIVTEVEIPPFPTRRSTYLKFAYRKSWDFSIASVAVSAVVDGGICQDVRIVLGGVATYPYRSQEAEEALRGNKIEEEVAKQAGEIALLKARPLRMNKYKVDLAKVLVRRALMAIADN